MDGSALPSREKEGQGLGGTSLLDDGGQLCVKVLTVEPLLKQDIRSVSHVVPARAKDRRPNSPPGQPLGTAFLGPGCACEHIWAGLAPQSWLFPSPC